MVLAREIETAQGTWQVLLDGDTVCIVDAEGRERCRSKGLELTAFMLAVRLSEMPFRSAENMDAALRSRATKFREHGASK